AGIMEVSFPATSRIRRVHRTPVVGHLACPRASPPVRRRRRSGNLVEAGTSAAVAAVPPLGSDTESAEAVESDAERVAEAVAAGGIRAARAAAATAGAAAVHVRRANLRPTAFRCPTT